MEKKFTLKSRADLVDYDYVDKLSDYEKKWLNDFTEEVIHASVDKDGKKNRFIKKRADIKATYNNNNARNRCTWTKEHAKGMANYLEDLKETLLSHDPESYIVEKMDLERDGWVNNNGDVLMTEEELFQELKKALDTKVEKK